MLTTPTDASAPAPRSAARLAGYSYIALFVLGIFGNFMVRERLIETGDATATFGNIADSESLVRWAIVAFLAAFVLDVVVAWALYHVFRPAGAALSALTAWFRIVYTVFLGVAVVFLFAVLQWIGDTGYVAALGQTARDTHAMLALDAFNATWLIGLTCFGIHLAMLGAMILRSRIASQTLGLLLIVAGGAYVFDTLAYSLLSTYTDHEAVFTAIVALPAVVAEASFMVWLLARAGKEDVTPAPEGERAGPVVAPTAGRVPQHTPGPG